MDLVRECCRGRDVHRDSVVTCLRRQSDKHGQA